MKYLLSIILTMTSIFFSSAKDEQGHVLGSLWKSYHKAHQEDRPRDEIKALEAIIKEAEERKLSWDFYDAWDKYVQAQTTLDWNSAQEYKEKMTRAVDEFGNATLIFFHKKEGEEFIEAHERELKSSYTPELYANDYRIRSYPFSAALGKLLKSDFDYACWANGTNSIDSYPFNALYELNNILNGLPVSQEKLEEYALSYKGKATGILAEDKLLRMRFSRLEEKKGPETEYLQLLKDCEGLIHRMGQAKGDEKIIAEEGSNARWILTQLKTQSLNFEIEDGKLTLMFRNRNSTRVRIYNKGEKTKTVFDKLVHNRQGSFSIEDSVAVDLPDLADGEYSIRLDGEWQAKTYSKHMLSIALRSYGQNNYVYVAYAQSGKPVEKCQIGLYDSDDKLIWEQSDLAIDGFTLLPPGLNDKLKNNRHGYYLKASLTENGGKTLSSKNISISRQIESKPDKQQSAILLTDRGAYNPGDVLKFKAVIYEQGEELRIAGKGLCVKAVLRDPQGRIVETQALTSNDFSSVQGSIRLNKGERGGSYKLSIEKDNLMLAARYVTVDEFVLPSFSLEWENERRSWLPGEEIQIKGHIFSYAGRKLSHADISYVVEKNGEPVADGKLSPGSEGDFSFSFKSDDTDDYAFYHIRVKLGEFSGETLEFSTSATVSRYIAINADITNTAKGRASGKGFSTHNIVDQSRVNIECSCDFPYSYSLIKDGDRLLGGKQSDESFSIELKGFEPGFYSIELEADEDSKERLDFFYAPEDMGSLGSEVDNFFKEVQGELAILMGSGSGAVWAVAELHGSGNILLDKKPVYIEGKENSQGSLIKLEFRKEANYPSDLSLNVFYFRDYDSQEYTASFKNELNTKDLPISISRFTDKALPGSRYTVSIQTEAGVECAASIFDISSENIRRNVWSKVYPYDISEISIRTREIAGSNSSEHDFVLYDNLVVGYGSRMVMSKSQLGSVETVEDSEGYVPRQNFLESLAWEPTLNSDENGGITFSFTSSDKLSRYAIQLFAHDRDMRNSVLRKEFSVSLPVQINISRPEYLYEADVFIANIEIQNNSESGIQGHFTLDFGKGVKKNSIRIPAGESYRFSQEIIAEKPGEMKVTAGFIEESSKLSDAISVSIPVKEAAQNICEAHSSIIREGQSKDEIISELARRFVNLDAATAEYEEISIIDLLRREMQTKLSLKSENAIDLSEVLLSNHLLKGINGHDALSEKEIASLTEKLIACQKGDGAFAWFSGMSSSIYVTAAVLENMAAMRESLPDGLAGTIPSALLYLHKKCKADDELYLYMRALFSDIRLEKANIAPRVLRKYADETRRGILAKARKIFILKTFGYGQQAERELSSLTQYAVEHSSGGCYFPNAVMPWRGLMESELHAHTLLCRILDSYGRQELAEGIRLWMMIQKESQQWGNDPAYVAAAATVLEGKDSTLATRIATLKAESRLPFSEISESGNGFRVNRSYYLNGKEIQKGESVKVGDKIQARYELWSDENRSFVKICIPRPAALRAVQQLSGMQAYGAYRSVEANQSCYWFDSYPERKIILEEEFFVVQEGSFDAGASTIESLYAPHYRANSDPISDFSTTR